MTSMAPLLEVRGLGMTFGAGRTGGVRAVDDVSFDIHAGETFGLVGESGSGKTTTGRCVVGLYRPTAGTVRYRGESVLDDRSRRGTLDFHREVQMIFQDPYASLDPRMQVREIVSEGLRIHGLARSRDERGEAVAELLRLVGLDPSHGDRYPHEFSGGQRQRIGIARALAVQPSLIVCDEPVSALDVSIQAQIVNLLRELQRERGLTYLFISHDLSLVRIVSDRVGILHAGRLVEVATSEEIFTHPLHPYTQYLLDAIPAPDPARARRGPLGLAPVGGGWQEPLTEVSPGHWVRLAEAVG